MRQQPFPLVDDTYYLEGFRLELEKLRKLVRKKRADYGSSIGFHGVKGIMPRIADKFFRLDHLVWDGETPKFESAVDTCRDIAVYALSMAIALEYEANNVGGAD